MSAALLATGQVAGQGVLEESPFRRLASETSSPPYLTFQL